MSARFIVADVFDGLAQLDENTVDLVFTSPPFLALRSYLPADHPDKAREIGSESTPAAFLDTLLDVVEACDRVLAPHGSLVFELGDTYGGHDNRGSGCDDGRHDAKTRAIQTGAGWPLNKSLCLIPQLFAASLAYGRNLLRLERETERWRVRNVVAFCRPNPPVGALGDKYRPATSYLTVACKSRDRYFDLDSTRSRSTNATGTTSGATLSGSAVGVEVDGTLDTGNDPKRARWWCDLRLAQITVDGPVTRNAEGLQVVELVGLVIGVETPEGPQVMDLQSGVDATSLASVPVAVESCLARHLPVGPSVLNAPTSVGGAVLALPVGAAPSAVAIEAAEVVRVDGALVTPDRLAARLTLKLDDALAYAFLVAPVTRTHEAHSTAGAPPLDFWVIPTHPYPGSHYATFPPELCTRPIKSMCPERVCLTCGQPSRRIVESQPEGRRVHAVADAQRKDRNDWNAERPQSVAYRTLGWSDCGHDNWRRGITLDPFAGSGTTLAVATGLGRDAIGIDLDRRNLDLARERVGMFLEWDDDPETVT